MFKKPGFPDNTVPIGHYSRYQQDKLGRGPQSVPAFHSHSAMYLLPEKIWDFIKQLPDKTDQEKDELFNQVLEIINPALGGGEVKWLAELAYEDEKIRARVPELMMKQVDPYSTIFFKAAGESYFLPKLELLLREIGINFVSMKSFIHHTDEKRKGDVRFAEGVKLTIAKADLPKFLSRFNKYLTELYQIWEIVKEIVDLKRTDNYSERERLLQILETIHLLPKRLLKLIGFIQPVGGTLYNLRVPKFQRFRDFVQKELKGVVDNDRYLGYNIPGVPSMGLTITANENAGLVDIWISPLFSLKGVAEQIVGLPIIRIEKREENK